MRYQNTVSTAYDTKLECCFAMVSPSNSSSMFRTSEWQSNLPAAHGLWRSAGTGSGRYKNWDKCQLPLSCSRLVLHRSYKVKYSCCWNWAQRHIIINASMRYLPSLLRRLFLILSCKQRTLLHSTDVTGMQSIPVHTVIMNTTGAVFKNWTFVNTLAALQASIFSERELKSSCSL